MNEAEVQRYKVAADSVLKRTLGDSGAKAILFYTGPVDPKTFESKLGSILGDGARIIIEEVRRQIGDDSSSTKHGLFARALPNPAVGTLLTVTRRRVPAVVKPRSFTTSHRRSFPSVLIACGNREPLKV